MRVLILGGTKFLGRHLVEAALLKNNEVTLFNRGQTNPEIFPGVERLRGNRDGDLDALRGRTWDVAIDTSGYVPRVVRDSVKLLADAVTSYIFVSSISVYTDFSAIGMNEDAPVGAMEDETSEEVGQFYGPLKALCEQEVQSVFGKRSLVVRPGLIVGPDDPTDRFTYWVQRFAEGGEVLVPGTRNRPLQFIDVRDLAKWMIEVSEHQLTGVFNVTGPGHPLTMGEFVSTLEAIVPSAGRAQWVEEEFLIEQDVKEWSEVPLWISEKTNWPGFMAVNVDQAIQCGLEFHPLSTTILDTLLWWGQSQPYDVELKAGISRERESELLRAWKSGGT